MTSDDQLRRAFDTLTDRLRDEIARQTQSAFEELTAARQVDQAGRVGQIGEVGHVGQEGQEGPESQEQREGQERRYGQQLERLRSAVRAIDEAKTLTEVLDALAAAASQEAQRTAVLLVRGGEYRAWQSIGVEPPHERGAVVEMAPGADIIPLAISGQIVAALWSQNPEGGTQNPALDILTRYAARSLESMTAFKAARAALASEVEPADPVDTNADEDVAARRYARLLVSEIKLYHEAEVVAGRRERDLATRLGGEISRARVLYEQRVPPEVRQHADYFRDELVRTLANGDATLLELRT